MQWTLCPKHAGATCERGCVCRKGERHAAWCCSELPMGGRFLDGRFVGQIMVLWHLVRRVKVEVPSTECVHRGSWARRWTRVGGTMRCLRDHSAGGSVSGVYSWVGYSVEFWYVR